MAFKTHWPEAWPDLEAAFEEVKELVKPEHICRAAMHGEVLLGVVGGLPEYDGHVWELHPLAVHPEYQRQGVGRALVRDFEAQVKARGGLTIILGSDDEDEMTTLAGVELYPDPWAHIAQIRNLKNHPFEFYQKLGYVISGIVPDANGRGKPDILMSKRVNA
ncbi:MAG: GNAT family N-acetyltransferase [Anaerolineales bacterium]|nr:GNAT family N-acetyltransferase [Anaerolineales bacterium]